MGEAGTGRCFENRMGPRPRAKFYNAVRRFIALALGSSTAATGLPLVTQRDLHEPIRIVCPGVHAFHNAVDVE